MRGKRGGALPLAGVVAIAGVLAVGACGDDERSGPATPDASAPSPGDGGGAGLTVAKTIGAAGGTLTTADGVTLVVPQDALTTDTEISITSPKGQRPTARGLLTWDLEPDGLVFARPVSFTMTYAPAPGGTTPTIQVFQSSKATPYVDVGRELSNFSAPAFESSDLAAHTLTVSLEHFSFIGAAVAVFEHAYQIIDVPPTFLRPGDILATLTGGKPYKTGIDDATWRPGHVALFTYPNRRDACAKDVKDEVIEAQPPRVVPTTTYGDPKTGQTGVRNDSGHLYLGPRRPTTGALTPAQGLAAANWAKSKVGTLYSPVSMHVGALQGVPPTDLLSCVGLVEKAYQQAGTMVDNSLIGLINLYTIPIPWEDYAASTSIEDVDIMVGESIDIEVSAAVVEPSSPYYGLMLAGSYSNYSPTCHVKNNKACSSYVLKAQTSPASAKFLPDKRNNGHYHFTYTAAAADAGKTFTQYFDMTADPHAHTNLTDADAPLGKVNAIDVLRIHVLSQCEDAGAPPPDASTPDPGDAGDASVSAPDASADASIDAGCSGKDLKHDVYNCGSCGHVCPGGDICLDTLCCNWGSTCNVSSCCPGLSCRTINSLSPYCCQEQGGDCNPDAVVSCCGQMACDRATSKCACRAQGETCNETRDCCTPDPMSTGNGLICHTGRTTPTCAACYKTGEACLSNVDCCAGLSCRSAGGKVTCQP